MGKKGKNKNTSAAPAATPVEVKVAEPAPKAEKIADALPKVETSPVVAEVVPVKENEEKTPEDEDLEGEVSGGTMKSKKKRNRKKKSKRISWHTVSLK